MQTASYTDPIRMEAPLAQTPPVKDLVDDVVERLEVAIFRGELLPGERIREARIAGDLGVSAGTVREALRQLEGRRVVVRSRNLGTSVVKLSDKEVLELIELRELLEVGAIRLAAINITDEHLERLRSLLLVLDRERPTRPQIFSNWRNLDFHYEIALASGNARLMQLLSGEIWILMRSYRFPGALSTGPTPQGAEEHREIVEALSRRDPDAAEAAMRGHLRNIKTEVTKFLSGEKRNKRGRIGRQQPKS